MVERFVYTEDVGGSSPSSPTISRVVIIRCSIGATTPSRRIPCSSYCLATFLAGSEAFESVVRCCGDFGQKQQFLPHSNTDPVIWVYEGGIAPPSIHTALLATGRKLRESHNHRHLVALLTGRQRARPPNSPWHHPKVQSSGPDMSRRVTATGAGSAKTSRSKERARSTGPRSCPRPRTGQRRGRSRAASRIRLLHCG